VCAAVAPKPVNALARGSALPLADLAAAGVRRISVGSALARAAYGGFMRAAREMSERGTFSFIDEGPSFADLSGFMAGR
jgi:2-methylisocitrate lyase-like PEP mutase family enzyme